MAAFTLASGFGGSGELNISPKVLLAERLRLSSNVAYMAYPLTRIELENGNPDIFEEVIQRLIAAGLKEAIDISFLGHDNDDDDSLEIGAGSEEITRAVKDL